MLRTAALFQKIRQDKLGISVSQFICTEVQNVIYHYILTKPVAMTIKKKSNPNS